MGYAHIDSEWLWDLKETTEVCKSTFKNALEIMEHFKNIVFELGPALCYELIEAEEPELLKKVIDKVKEGRWRIAGAPFLEFDSYMPSGEFIVRHLLYGHKYFKKYGVNIEPVLFLPDSFGFPLTLPKILRGFNIMFFATYKPKWNDTNEVKYNVFYWGTSLRESVLAYILPGNYNDYLSDIKRILWNLYKQYMKQKIPVILVVYGRGDHGGGPEEDEAKNLELWKKLYPFLKLTLSGMQEFFKYIEHAYGRNLPLLNDELYLEFHRGVYTTGATAKKLNRINENLALQVEKFYTLLKILYGHEYPYEEINALLRKILINQGHDSLPSTVTPEVYKDIINRGFETFKSLLKMMRNGLKKLCKITGSSYLVFNPNNQKASVYLQVSGNVKGYCQHMNNGMKLCYVENLPPLGYIAFNSIGNMPQDTVHIRSEDKLYILENRYLKVIISKKNGWITSVFDKMNKREILKGPIRMRILWDTPFPSRMSVAPAVIFDSWEVFYKDMINKYLYRDLKAHSHEISEKGPLYASVKLSYKYRQFTAGTSYLELEVGLYADKPYLEIKFRGIWRAKHRFLKLLVPLKINTENAVFEVPYGIAVRKDSCLSKNPVDKARFEVPGQRWVDISNGDYGVAIMTDSLYGYSWCNGTIGVSLLRAPSPPDKDLIMKFVESMKDVQRRFMDVAMELSGKLRKIGISFAIWINVLANELLKLRKLRPIDHSYHTATIWIYPHKGDYAEGAVPKYANELNTSYVVYSCPYSENEGNVKSFSLIRVEPSETVEIVAVKPCEEDDCIVIRLYNTAPRKIIAELKTSVRLGEVYEADLAENPRRKIKHEQYKLSIELKAYEIKTLLIRFYGK